MSHDARGVELKEGDEVILVAKVVKVYPTEDACNCELESVNGRRPDGLKERIYAINTGVLLKLPAVGEEGFTFEGCEVVNEGDGTGLPKVP